MSEENNEERILTIHFVPMGGREPLFEASVSIDSIMSSSSKKLAMYTILTPFELEGVVNAVRDYLREERNEGKDREDK